MQIQNVRIRRAGTGEEPAAWAAALGDASWLAAAHILKHDDAHSPASKGAGHWVCRATLRDREVVLKCRPTGLLAERFKLLIRHGRGDRHWKGAAWLARHGFRTATPFVLATATLDGRPVELLVMEALPGRTVLEHLAAGDLSVKEEHAAAAALGQMVERFCDLRAFNRDNKPSNLILLRDSALPTVAIVDCVAIRPVPHAAQMYASLVIEPIDQGCRPRRSLMMAALRASHQHINHSSRGSHLDGTPRKAVIRHLWQAASRRIDRHFASRSSE